MTLIGVRPTLSAFAETTFPCGATKTRPTCGCRSRLRQSRWDSSIRHMILRCTGWTQTLLR